MNYVGKRVFHKAKFGEGVIVDQDQSNHITVQFDSFPETKSFIVPICFTNYLQLLDAAVAKRATEEARVHEEKAAAEKAQKEQEQRLKVFERQTQIMQSKGNPDKQVTVPRYNSLDEFFDDQERLLLSEIVYLRQNGGKRQKIVDGERVEYKNGIYIYAFESDSELNIPDNTPISLWQNENEIAATIINREEFTLIMLPSVDSLYHRSSSSLGSLWISCGIKPYSGLPPSAIIRAVHFLASSSSSSASSLQ